MMIELTRRGEGEREREGDLTIQKSQPVKVLGKKWETLTLHDDEGETGTCPQSHMSRAVCIQQKGRTW